MAMLRANFVELRSAISHFNCSCALKAANSCGKDMVAKMSSTWIEKMMVLKGDEW